MSDRWTPFVDAFLEGPRGAAEWFADGVRVLGALSILIALARWEVVDVAVFALASIGLVLPRFLGVRPALDGAIGVALLVASWSSVLGLYRAWASWDVVVHFALNGLIAAVAYILAARAGVVPSPAGGRGSLLAPIVLTACFGLATGVLWEWGEWAGHTFLDPEIFVAYEDTLGDLAAGGAGSVLAGVLMRYLSAGARVAPERRRRAGVVG